MIHNIKVVPLQAYRKTGAPFKQFDNFQGIAEPMVGKGSTASLKRFATPLTDDYVVKYSNPTWQCNVIVYKIAVAGSLIWTFNIPIQRKWRGCHGASW